jgi:hypothetical protein
MEGGTGEEGGTGGEGSKGGSSTGALCTGFTLVLIKDPKTTINCGSFIQPTFH